MALAPGDRVGVYEIGAQLGAGGMGEVWRARDTKLGRDVAIKVLPAAMADDAQYMARFEREAQTLASLNHPNIATVYGIEQGALVMELVEGEDLHGPVPVETALAYARQIALGLEAAHEKGIIHRDLKPANIKVKRDGVVKLLDFGLAKVADRAPSEATLTLSMTQAGMILGTAAYMSPEQARGNPVDQRADIWAFGVVLYEMLAGQSLFATGETVTDIIAAVVTREPDWNALPKDTPERIRRLLKRCLRKDVRTRLQAIAEARIAIDEPDEAPAAIAAPAVARSPRWPYAAVAVAAALIAAGVFYWRRPVPAAVDFPARFSVMPPPGYRFVLNAGHSVSPDGRRLAMILLNLQATSRQIWVRDLDSTKMEPLAGTEGAYALFWSPDSRSIGFRGEGKLKRVDLDGHQVQSICDAPGSADGATWNAEGTILFGLFGRPIMRVNASGGTPTPAVGDSLDVGKLTEGYPQFLPDGRHFLFAVARSGQKDGIYAASLDGKEPARRILESAIEAIFAADSDESKGYLFFKRQNTVMAIRFDAGKLAVSGDPFVVIESGGPSSIRLPVSVSSPARVIVWREDSDGQMDAAELVMLDRAGTRLASIGAGSGAAHVELSPDGTRLLAERTDPRTANAGLWTFDLGRKVASRLSFGNGNQGPAVWSADGQKILFFAESDGVAGLYAAPSDGSGRPDLFFKGGLHHLHASADGKYVAFEAGVAGASDIHLLDLQKGGEPTILIKSTAAVSNPQFSPDGRWLAYSSLEGAQRELFVQSFPAGGGRWQVSNAGETVARWRHDGRELVYYDGKGHVLAVSVALRGSALELGTPVKLFDANFMNGYFAMSGDGQRFYANMMPVTTERTVEAVPLTVILNWSAGLKR